MTQEANNMQDIMNENAIENAVFGDWVYFIVEYDAGNILVPEDTGARIRNDPMPDEMPIPDGYHSVDIKLYGRYYEIEVPYDVLEMQ